MINTERMTDFVNGNPDQVKLARTDAMAELFLQMNREQGVTMVVVTHNEGLAGRMGKLFRLEEGKLVQGK